MSAHPITSDPVLVTGATGYIGLFIVKHLLDQGYAVRGTARDSNRAASVHAVLEGAGTDPARLELVAADLRADAGWNEAVQGCRFVLHVASPVPSTVPRDEDEVIRPAREGTLRVLNAASAAGVERVVLTSSISAINAGHEGDEVYDEGHWSNLDGKIGAYEKSKTLAERAAWDFVEHLPPERSMELVVVNPGMVLGPLLEADVSASLEVVRKPLSGEVPGIPYVTFAFVDVRELAELHLVAMALPEAAGKRFVVAGPSTEYVEVARILAERFNPDGFRVPTRRVPNFVLRLMALFDRTTALLVPRLGRATTMDSSRAREILGWKPRPLAETVIAAGEGLVEHGVVKPRTPKIS